MQGDEQAVDVKDRQRVQQHVVRGEAPGRVKGQGVGGQGAVAEHRPLGPARRAAGIDQGRQGVRVAGVNGARRFKRRGLRGQGQGVANHELGFCVLKKIGHLRLGVGRVQRGEDRTNAQAGQI